MSPTSQTAVSLPMCHGGVQSTSLVLSVSGGERLSASKWKRWAGGGAYNIIILEMDDMLKNKFSVYNIKFVAFSEVASSLNQN